jgi:predicted AlkP superfamily phosphohydrolase/phosphomutase
MRKIVLLSIDGLSNTVLNVLLRDNKLPTFKKLINSGTKRTLFDINRNDPWETFYNYYMYLKRVPCLGVHTTTSLWTTLATGVTPDKHGVISSTEQDVMGVERFVSRKNRKKPTMWEVVSQHNKKIGIIGWIANCPPICAPYYTIAKISDILEKHHPPRDNVDSYNNLSFNRETFLSNPTYPPGLWKELKKIPFDSKINEFIHKISSELYIGQPEAIHDSFYLEWAKFLLKRFPQPDFLAICLFQIHNFSHLFWDCLKIERAHFKGVIHRNRQKKFGYVIEDSYQYLDKKIAEILELIESNSIIIIVSPYGMHRSRITKKYLLMNRIYKELGLLKYSEGKIDWEKTKVYDNQNPWGIFAIRKGFIRDDHPEKYFYKLRTCFKKIKTERNENLLLEITYNKQDNSFEVVPNYKAIHYHTKIFLNNRWYPAKNLVHFLPHYSLHNYSDGTIIISGKDNHRIKIVKSKITLLDIAPTVFSLLGIKYRDKDMLGEPIVNFRKYKEI